MSVRVTIFDVADQGYGASMLPTSLYVCPEYGLTKYLESYKTLHLLTLCGTWRVIWSNKNLFFYLQSVMIFPSHPNWLSIQMLSTIHANNAAKGV